MGACVSRSAWGSPRAAALSDSVRPERIVGAISEARVWMRDSRRDARVAEPADAAAICAILGEAFEDSRSWAPSEWAPPVPTQADVLRCGVCWRSTTSR